MITGSQFAKFRLCLRLALNALARPVNTDISGTTLAPDGASKAHITCRTVVGVQLRAHCCSASYTVSNSPFCPSAFRNVVQISLNAGSPPLLWRIGDEDEPSSLIRLSSLMRRTFSARSEHLLRPRSAAIEVVEMLQ